MAAAGAPSSDAGDHSAYTMGMRFVLSVNANLIAIKWWRATTSSPPPTLCGVYDDDTGVLVATAETFADPGVAVGEITQTLVTPVPLLAATAYRVAVYGATLGYSATGAYWSTGDGAAGITSGIITAPNDASSGGQDRFHSGSGMTYPNQAFNAGNYWIDLAVDDGVGSTVDLAGKLAASASAKTSMRRARTLAAKAPAAAQAKASLIVLKAGWAGRASAAALVKASMRVAKVLSGKAQASASAKATLRRTRSVAGRAMSSTSARASLTINRPAPPDGQVLLDALRVAIGLERWTTELGADVVKQSTNEYIPLVIETPKHAAITDVKFVISQTQPVPPGAVYQEAVTDIDGNWFCPVGSLYPVGAFTDLGTWFVNARIFASNGEQVDRLAGWVQVDP